MERTTSSPYEARAWRADVGQRRYMIHEISDREGDLYLLNVEPSAYGFEAFVDRDGNETDARTSRASFRSKAETVRAARKHTQRKHVQRSER